MSTIILTDCKVLEVRMSASDTDDEHREYYREARRKDGKSKAIEVILMN